MMAGALQAGMLLGEQAFRPRSHRILQVAYLNPMLLSSRGGVAGPQMDLVVQPIRL